MSQRGIYINDVCFHYNEEKNASADHVNLEIKEGEVVVLCGESGCGKTTIIRLINGLIPFYYKGHMKGQVKVFGHLTQVHTMIKYWQSMQDYKYFLTKCKVHFDSSERNRLHTYEPPNRNKVNNYDKL